MSALGASAGRAALACALGVAAGALTGWMLFLHVGVPDALPASVLLREAACGALALAGAALALHALRRGGRPGAAEAAAALVLLAPFLADALLAPLERQLPGGAPRRAAFLVVTESIAVAALLAGRRAWRRGPAPPRPAWLAAAGRWTARVSLALAAAALSIAGAELLLRHAGLGAPRYAAPMILVPGDERRVPFSEIALFSKVGPPAPGELGVHYRPYVFFKGWYDRPVWPYFHADGTVDYVFDAHGLRDHDFPLDKPAGEYRVLALGDSFTFGAGVPLDDCWTEVLERGLHQRLGRPVEVVNAGFVAGKEPSGYDEWLAQDGLRLAPDVVIVGLCLNDLNDAVQLYAFEPRVPPRQHLAGRSRILNALQDACSPAPGPRVPIDWTALVQAAPAEWLRAQESLRNAHATLAAHGIRMLVVAFPMLSGLRDGYPYAGLHEMVAQFCRDEGLETVDLLPRFLGRQDETLQVHPTDQHPNDLGHRLIAEGLLEYLAPP